MNLNMKKNRDLEKKFIVENSHLLKEAYNTNNLIEIFKTKDCDLSFNVKTTIVDENKIKKLSELKTPTNIIGICKYLEEKELKNKILILDEIRDPGNLGTIIRSAVAFNIDTIVLGENTVDLYNDKVIRASQGMLFHINIIKRNLTEFIIELKEKGYYIYATSLATNKENIEKKEKYAIIVGNEGQGIKQEILNLADGFIKINMNSNCESLNVGVATSIILYELNK